MITDAVALLGPFFIDSCLELHYVTRASFMHSGCSSGCGSGWALPPHMHIWHLIFMRRSLQSLVTTHLTQTSVCWCDASECSGLTPNDSVLFIVQGQLTPRYSWDYQFPPCEASSATWLIRNLVAQFATPWTVLSPATVRDIPLLGGRGCYRSSPRTQHLYYSRFVMAWWLGISRPQC